MTTAISLALPPATAAEDAALPLRTRVKLLADERGGRVDVVDVRHGEKLPDGYAFSPIPLCRLVTGYGRPFGQVLADAERIAALWNCGS